ncbi:MAG TPA: class II aldolase/adducin family protein [Anaerolineales bacterium]|nr:class II aldolase/adducin family protein [Anaerolineales bacterium]
MIDHSADTLFRQIGDVGKRLSDLGAAEGAAGNMSVCVREGLVIPDPYVGAQSIDLPLDVPELSGASVIVTGSGCRLRDIADVPSATLAIVVIDNGGKTGRLFTAHDANFRRITSEFNSHLAIHYEQMKSSDVTFHTVLHAQPSHLTYLSHIPEYQNEAYFNRHLFRWQPETILSIPQGIGVLPFIVNGSDEQMTETAMKMKEHPLVVWARHGVVARADESVIHALDLMEYAEAAAHYEYLNLSAGGKADGLSPDEIRQICKAWNISQSIY